MMLSYSLTSSSQAAIQLPSVRYRSCGFQINPNIYKCGQVSLSLYSVTNFECVEREDLWVPGTSNVLDLLVVIRDVFLKANPLFNTTGYRNKKGCMISQQTSLLYNENTIIKSLKTMVNTMNKPPKNFENLVIGHFRSRVRDILTACKFYMEGGFLEGKKEERCSIKFKNDVASCIKPLVDAFIRIGAKEALEFLPLSDKNFPVPDKPIFDNFFASSRPAQISTIIPELPTKRLRLTKQVEELTENTPSSTSPEVNVVKSDANLIVNPDGSNRPTKNTEITHQQRVQTLSF